MNKSICIILNQYKKEHITEEEAVKLIEDLYRNNNGYYFYPTYEQKKFPQYTVTCTQYENN